MASSVPAALVGNGNSSQHRRLVATSSTNNNSTGNGSDDHINAPLSPSVGGGNGGGGREVEQRFARIVAEYEYKILEERGRAQEREAQLLEELQRERAQAARLLNEPSQRQQQQEGQGRGGTSLVAGGRRDDAVSREDHERLQQQLLETRGLLQEAERRYQQEKRELLNLRTAQLRSETSKRGQEGDIIARAMQVMSEYEAVVRSSEENSLARLSHHMETFEQEWVRRSREFEEQKVTFEAAMLEKTRQALAAHQHDVESISRALLEKTTQTLSNHNELRLEMEEQVMRHAEIFKEEYKAILEKEFYDRCRLYDEKIAERERGWVKVLQEERKKIVAAEQRAVKEHEALHVQALEDAMRDLSQLREQLVREHQEQQTEAMKELITRRENLQRDHEGLIAAMNKKTQEMQRECAATVEAVQDEMRKLHVRMAAKEAEMAQRLHDAEQKVDTTALAKAQQIRDEVEQKWSSMLAAERATYTAELQRVSSEHQRQMERVRSEQVERDGALLASYEQRVVKVEEAAEQRWGSRVEEAMHGLERHMEVVQLLRRDNEGMAARITGLTQELQLKAAELEGAVGRARREQDAMWHRKLEEMRQRYDNLLDEALGGTDGAHVPRAEYDAVVRSVKEWEEKCVALKQQNELQLEREREQLNIVWGQRLDGERAQRTEWEAERQQYFTALRDALLQDMRAREASAAAGRR
ncbi:hypothetical protein DQ04_06311000, partial [Trypanosoma grayi]|uniref:hypothetical protein n=1 Tax=Trypanosoma grayi TaxID=71804 RepID=UPI0004F4B495